MYNIHIYIEIYIYKYIYIIQANYPLIEYSFNKAYFDLLVLYIIINYTGREKTPCHIVTPF